jgi:hypothetical protein
MSGQYKVAWLCEALLVSRSGYYHWVERRRKPSPRQLENIEWAYIDSSDSREGINSYGWLLVGERKGVRAGLH